MRNLLLLLFPLSLFAQEPQISDYKTAILRSISLRECEINLAHSDTALNACDSSKAELSTKLNQSGIVIGAQKKVLVEQAYSNKQKNDSLYGKPRNGLFPRKKGLVERVVKSEKRTGKLTIFVIIENIGIAAYIYLNIIKL
jgi:hypothetical protein